MLSLRHVLGCLLALTVLVSGIIRPPGTMLVMQGETLTYTLCTGGQTHEIAVDLDADDNREIDLSCDFFATQIAALPLSAPFVAPSRMTAAMDMPPLSGPRAPLRPWLSYVSRAPPVPS